MMNKQKTKVTSIKVTTQKDASRVQKAVALANNGLVPKGSVAARMTSAAHLHVVKK